MLLNACHEPVQYYQLSVTVKPVCNDNLYNKTNYLWFI